MEIFIKNGIVKDEKEVKQDIYKKCFDAEFDFRVPGPYSDVNHNHVHVWKSLTNIQNFRGVQFQTEVKFSKIKGNIPTKGTFCCICHEQLKSKQCNLKYNPILTTLEPFKKEKHNFDLYSLTQGFKKLNKNTSIKPPIEILPKRNYSLMWDRFYVLLSNYNEQYYKHIFAILKDVINKKQTIINNWKLLVTKIQLPYILYNVSETVSLYKKPWELTNYQKLTLKNPNYRDTYSFIVKPYKKFERYVVIE
jgi:hypothetical protein